MAKNKARKKPAKRPVKKAVKRVKTKAVKKSKRLTKDVCCVKEKFKDWNLKQHVWKKKPFFVVKHGLFFHIPINFGGVIKDAMGQLEKKYKMADNNMMLERELNWFSGKLMFSIKKPSRKDPNVEYISGTFISKVHNGPYNKLGEAVAELSKHVRKKRGTKPIEFYYWYTVCPVCSKKLGGNQTIIFARMF